MNKTKTTLTFTKPFLCLVLLGILSFNRMATGEEPKVQIALSFTDGSNAPRIQVNLPELVTISEENLLIVQNANNYLISIDGGWRLTTQSMAKPREPQKVRINRGGGEQDKIGGLFFDMGTLILSQADVNVTITLTEPVAKLLNQDNVVLTAKGVRVVRGTEKYRAFGSSFGFDGDVSRIEQGSNAGAFKHTVNLDLWFPSKSTDFHAGVKSEGTTFLEHIDKNGSISFQGNLGWMFVPSCIITSFGALDIAATATSENDSDFKFGTWNYGVSFTCFPRLDRLIAGPLAESMGAKTLNVPPALRIFGEYVTERQDDANILEDNGVVRGGLEFNWYWEFNPKFYIKTQWRETFYKEAPLEGTTQKSFHYLDLTANYKVMDNLHLVLRYTDGKLAPLYKQDEVVTAGFRLKFDQPE